jgi:hypothetical protein
MLGEAVKTPEALLRDCAVRKSTYSANAQQLTNLDQLPRGRFLLRSCLELDAKAG